MKKLFLLIIFLLISSAALMPQNLNGRFSSSVYMFERFDSVNASKNYARAYQMLTLNLNKGKYSLRTYMNLENDLSQSIDADPRLRFYNLYLEGRNLLNMFTVKIGRQPLITNVAGGLFDGANVDVKYDVFKLTGFYGGNVPDYQKLEFTDDFKNNFVFGGRLTAAPLQDLRVAVGYIKKNFSAFRPEDESGSSIQQLIEKSSSQYEFLSAEASYGMAKLFDVDARFEYDLNFEQPSKYEITGSYLQVKDFSLDIYYNYREPRVRYNSIFSVFDYGNTQEIELGGSYRINEIFTVSGRYGNVNYKDEENSARVTAGLNTSYGSITYRKNFGYSGELDALTIYSAYSFFEGLITPSLGLSFTNYKLSQDSEKNNLNSILAGLNYRPWRDLSFDLQGQYMDNKIYQNDYRFFLKVNYWFNTNF